MKLLSKKVSMMGPAFFGQALAGCAGADPKCGAKPPRDSDLPPPALATWTRSDHWQVLVRAPGLNKTRPPQPEQRLGSGQIGGRDWSSESGIRPDRGIL
jgi:hypothetical protein